MMQGYSIFRTSVNRRRTQGGLWAPLDWKSLWFKGGFQHPWKAKKNKPPLDKLLCRSLLSILMCGTVNGEGGFVSFKTGH